MADMFEIPPAARRLGGFSFKLKLIWGWKG